MDEYCLCERKKIMWLFENQQHFQVHPKLSEYTLKDCGCIKKYDNVCKKIKWRFLWFFGLFIRKLVSLNGVELAIKMLSRENSVHEKNNAKNFI